MPIYDWFCGACDKKVTDVLSRGADILCPYCGGKMVRMHTAPTLIFKGDGWDSNSYKQGDKK